MRGSLLVVLLICFAGDLFAQEPSPQGFLSVRSDPAGATVFVDGVEKGVTPIDRLPLTVGPHSLDVVSPCHEDNLGYNRGREIVIDAGTVTTVAFTLTDRIEKLTLVTQDKTENPLAPVTVFARGAIVGKAPGSFLLPVCVGTVTLAKDGYADASVKVDLREPKKLTVKMVPTGKPSPLLAGTASAKPAADIPAGLPTVSILPTPLSTPPVSITPVAATSAPSSVETSVTASVQHTGFDTFKKDFPYFWYGVGVASGGVLVALGGIICNHFADKSYDRYGSLSDEERVLEEMAKPGFDRDAYLARIDRAKADGDDMAWARNGLYIAGAAIFAGGVVLAFFPELNDEKKKVSFRFAPGYLPGGAGVSFDLKF